MKLGRLEKGVIFVVFYIGNLVGLSKVFESIFEKYGVIFVENLE